MKQIRRPYQIAILALLLVSTGLLYLSKTGSGQRLLLNTVTKSLENRTGYSLTAQETGGTWPWHITLDEIKISKDGRAVADVNMLDLRWSPLSTVKGPLQIKKFVAGSIRVHTGALESSGSNQEGFRLPSLDDLPSLSLSEFEIASLILISPDDQSSAPYVIFGTSSTAPGRAEVTASLLAHDATRAEDQISIDLTYDRENDLFSLESDIILKKDGILSWLGQEKLPLPILVKTEGTQKASDWKSHTVFAFGNMVSGDVTVGCDCLAGRNVFVSGSVDPKGIDLSFLPFSTSGQIKFGVMPAYDEDAKEVSFRNLKLETTGAELFADLNLSYANNTYRLGGEARLTAHDGPLAQSDLGTIFLTFEDLNEAASGWTLGSAHLETLRGSVTAEKGLYAKSGAMSSDLSGTFDPKELLQPSDPLWDLPALNWKSEFSYNSGDIVALKNFTAETGDRALNLTANAEYSLERQALVANVEGTANDLLITSDLYFPAQSAFSGTIDLDHSISTSHINLVANLGAFTFQKFQAPPTLLNADLKNWRSLDLKAIKGSASLVATEPSSDLSNFSSNISFTSQNSPCLIQADLLATGQYSAQLNLCATSPVADMWNARLSAKNFHGGPIAGRSLALDATTQKDGSWNANLIGHDLTYNAVKLQEVGASGRLEAPIEGYQLAITSARVLHQETEYQIKETAVIDLKSRFPDNLTITSDNGGWASLTSAKTESTFTANLDARDFKVPVAPALLNGKARLSFGADQHSGDFAMSLGPLLSAQQSEQTQTAQFDLKGRWNGQALSGDIDMALLEGGTISNITRIGEFAIPLKIDPSNEVPLSTSGPIAAALHYEGPVERILALLPFYDHSATGHFSAIASLTSEASSTKWQGQLALENATYIYKTQNLFVEGLNVKADLGGTSNALSATLSVRQHEEGRDKATLKGDGTFVFQSMDNWKGALDIVLDRNKLLQHQNYQGTLSGKLRGTINQTEASLKGEVRADRIEGSIPAPSSKDIIKLNIIRVDDQGEPITKAKRKGGTALIPPLDLDIALGANEQLFVRGRGLDTEWGGNVKLAGTSDRPELVGALELRRGQIMFGGRAFEIEAGTITMTGRDFADPLIELSATNKIGGAIQAKIIVEGRASEPKVRFESTPSMPEEDIVAYILFGKPVIELGPLEAVRTAVAIAQISGRAGFGTSLADRARQAIGVDVLQFTPPTGADGEGSILTVGKYLTSDIFLSISEDFETQIGSAGVEVKVTDSISVGAKVDETAETEASIEWSKNY